MSREELNKRQKVLNLLFTVKVPIGNNLYRVYKPLYKDYALCVWAVFKGGVRRIIRIRIDTGILITIISTIAAITTIVMGVRSCV